MNNPLVSVVIPTFNRAFCISEALESVLMQSHGRLEVLVVDDGSTDETEAIVGKMAKSDERIRYVYQENGGVSAARNHALRLAQGDFVAFLDSDDLWKPWKIELQLDCLNRFPHAGMIWTDMEAIDGSGKIVSPRYLRTMYSAYEWYTTDDLFPDSCPLSEISKQPPDIIADHKLYTGDIFSQMIVGNLVHTSTVLLKREMLEQVGEFCEEMRHGGEDYHFHLMTCREGDVAFADVPSIQYRVGVDDQITNESSTIHFARSYLKTISEVLERDFDRITLNKSEIEEILADAHAWIGEQALDLGERQEARIHLTKSLKHRIYQPRLVALLVDSLLPKPVEKSLRNVYRIAKTGFARS